MCSTNNCPNLFYSLSHVLREFNHCYGFFENSSLCSYLDEELKHCLLFYHINDDAKENGIKYIEYKLLRLNPIKYVSMALESSSTNKIEEELSNNNNLLLTIIYFSTTITLSPSSTTNVPIVPIICDGNISGLLTKLLNGNDHNAMDTLALHSMCHCIDYEVNERDLIETIHYYLGKTHYDPYFDRHSLSDKAVQFSTLRLHTNRQLLLNRLWSNIAYRCLSIAIFERNYLNKKLIKCLLDGFRFENEELVISQILYCLTIGPMISLNVCHKYLINLDDKDENNEILSVDLDWVPIQSNEFESDEILTECLMEEEQEEEEEEKEKEAHKKYDDALDYFLEYILNDDEECAFQWTLIWKYFDNPLCCDFDLDSLLKLTKISIDYENIEPFLQNMYGNDSIWYNKTSYAKIISNSLSCASMHCNENNQIIDNNNRYNGNGWNSLDLYNILLLLSNTNLYLDMKYLLKKGIDLSPDVVIYGIICCDIECSLKEEILDGILPTYLNSNNLDIKLNQFSILCHSDQYLFCKYIRFMGNNKIIEITDILNKLYSIHNIDPLRILTHFITAHSSSLSFPILLSICLHSNPISKLNNKHINWFLSNGLQLCHKQFYNALINLIITDYNEPIYIKFAFIHLFKLKGNKYLRQTQITFLYQLLVCNFSILCNVAAAADAADDDLCNDLVLDLDLNLDPALYKVLNGSASSSHISGILLSIDALDTNNFSIAIILLVIYHKIDLFIDVLENNNEIKQYLLETWPIYSQYINKITNNKLSAIKHSCSYNDPFPLIDIIRIYRSYSDSDLDLNKQQSVIIMNGNNKKEKSRTKTKTKTKTKEGIISISTLSKQKKDQIKKATIDRINILIADLNDDNRANRISEIVRELNGECLNNNQGLLSWFARVLVHRSSTDFESQSIYIELLEEISNKTLFETVINLTYDAISSLLSSSTINEQSQQRMILRGLGSWIGKLTIGRTRALLQKKLNLRTLIVVAYEENRLIVVIPFVSKILESTIGNTIFCPPNPWLMSILSLIAELHIYVEKLAVTYEIEQLFQHLNISAKTIEPTNIIRERIKKSNLSVSVTPPSAAAAAAATTTTAVSITPPSAAAAAAAAAAITKPLNIAASSINNNTDNNAFIDFKNLKTRIPNLVQYVRVKEFAEKMENDYGIMNFCDIIAHGFDRCVCEIVPVCVERSIDVACICSRELVVKDTISEISSQAIRKCANQMVSTLSGALTLVICREPIKVSAVQQIKKCLKDAGYLQILKQYQNNMDTIINSIVECNLDLVCNMAEKLAADRATKILEHNLGGLFSSRSPKTHPIDYNKQNIRMQRRVYEDFDTIRSMLRASCRDGFTEWNLIYQKFIFKFNKFEQQITSAPSADNNNDNLNIDIADLLNNLLFSDNNNKKTQTLHFIINKILSFEHIASLQNTLFMILTMVRDSHKSFTSLFTKSWLSQNNLENILNKQILLGLLDYNLIKIDDIDKFIAQLIIKKRDEKAIRTAIEIIRNFVLCRKFSLSDFKCIHDALFTLRHTEKVSLLFKELNAINGGTANEEVEIKKSNSSKKQPTATRYINYQTRVIDLLRKSFSIKGAHQSKVYNDFITNEMAQFLANQQAMCRFLEVSIKIVIGKCSEDLKKGGCFGRDLKDVIDAFGKLVVSCIRRIDFKLMIGAFFNCIQNDIMNRIKTKASNLFNQRPYLRLIVFVLFEVSEITFIHRHHYPLILLRFAQFLYDIRPQICPEFIFGWMQLLSHSKFMPKILSDQQLHKQSVIIFHDLLMSLLEFVDPFWRSPSSPPSVCLLFQGTLRILLVLLHDFPSFLCEFHFSFCQNIPISSFQMRNLVLSAFPKNTQLPDPFQPNLNLQSIEDMDKEPKISSNFMKNITSSIKQYIDSYHHKEIADVLCLNNNNNNSTSRNYHHHKRNHNHSGFVIRYNVSLINSIILYLANKKLKSTNNKIKMMDFLYYLALELDAEGRYHLFNAVCNNLRYPNSHTKFCSETVLFMFKKSNVTIKEQITRILLERLVVHRPHPWGLLITFIQLIKQPEYKFWDEPFTRSIDELQSLFQTVASSCFRVFN